MTISFRIMVFMILAAAVIPPSIKATNSRKLVDTTPTTKNHVRSLKDEIKCGTCPCGTICYTSPPPPPPSKPPPPKKPSPPSGGGHGGGSVQAPPDVTYITGPPKEVYPVVQSISGARRSFTLAPELLWLSGLLLGMLTFW